MSAREAFWQVCGRENIGWRLETHCDILANVPIAIGVMQALRERRIEIAGAVVGFDDI